MDGTDVASTDVADAGVAVAHGMTVAELHAMDGTDDGRRWELVDGELFVTPAPRIGHQQVVLRIASLLADLLGDRRVFPAPLDIQLDQETNVQPDVVVFSHEDVDRLDANSAPPSGMVPEFVVEVSSPSTRRLDLVYKRRSYERSGVTEYWFVDRDAGVVDVYAFGADDDLRTCGGEDRIASDLVDLDVTVAELLAW